jgi:hypothetical protein
MEEKNEEIFTYMEALGHSSFSWSVCVYMYVLNKFH